MIVRPDGPIPCRLMIVGEAPGYKEELRGVPFVGASGMELNRMLGEAGLSRSESFITNVARERPQGNDISFFIAKSKKDITQNHHPLRDKWVTRQIIEGFELLKKEISFVKPNVIIALGNVPLWALTGKWGISKWRGSMLYTDFTSQGSSSTLSAIKVIPTIHPAAILREWSQRPSVVHDLKRARRFIDGQPYPKPSWNFLVRPGISQVRSFLNSILNSLIVPRRISFDLETRAGHIACAGISHTKVHGLCIPFMCMERREGYWCAADEGEIIYLLWRVLTHRNARVIGQNLLYDSQYTWRHWGFVPRVSQDTMISQHSIFADSPKNLGYISSLYCNYYVYWKDEGKNWDPKVGEDQLWYYNLEDCVYTAESADVLLSTADQLGLRGVHDMQQAMFWPVLQAMQIGVRIDLDVRGELTSEVQSEIEKREGFLKDVLGHPVNPRSPKQMQCLFYDDLKLPIQMTRALKGVPARVTLNDEALEKLKRLEPLCRPIITAIQDIRTLSIFLGTFLEAELDIDGRMRTAFNIGGSESGKSAPKTFRLSSSENAFGGGANLQTIPSEKSKSVGKAAARGSIPALGDPYQFPNIRRMFVPDPGKIWFDGDLDRADLQVVVYEADDLMLKSALKMGADIHLMNVFSLEGKDPPPLEELVETHSRYWTHRGPRKHAREFSKVFCHGTNYGGQSRTMAANTGRTVHEIDRAQRIWFGAHPGIPRWHDRVKAQVTSRRFIENRFGYRWYIFDRIDSIIPEAIAWIPQSTVSNVINKIWLNIYNNLPEVQVLLQVHDSLCGQMPSDKADLLKPKILENARILVPYDDPLIIPFSLKTSAKSWGDC